MAFPLEASGLVSHVSCFCYSFIPFLVSFIELEKRFLKALRGCSAVCQRYCKARFRFFFSFSDIRVA
jgi:hypothetical protein